MIARVLIDVWLGGRSLVVVSIPGHRPAQTEESDSERNSISALLAGELEAHDAPHARAVREDRLGL